MCGRNQLDVVLLHVVSCNDGSATRAGLSGGHSHHELASLAVINLEAFLVSLHHEEVLKRLQEEHLLDFGVVLAALDRTEVVVLDCVDEDAVLAHHAQLDDVVRELHPLQQLVVVHIDLIKELGEVSDQRHERFVLLA